MCAERSPYYANPYHPSFDELSEQIDAMFMLAGHIGKFDITGGEPFLRKDLPDIMRYIHDRYFDHVDMLRVTTNGTLLPPSGFIEAAGPWGDRFYCIIDRYAVSRKSEEAGDMLAAAGVPHEIRDYSDTLHCDGWIDYGDFSLKHSDEEAQRLFSACMVPKLGFFTCMVNGRVFPCAKARLLFESDIVDVSMDALDAALTQDEKRIRLSELLGDRVVKACKYCNGLCSDSVRIVPAEQL